MPAESTIVLTGLQFHDSSEQWRKATSHDTQNEAWLNSRLEYGK